VPAYESRCPEGLPSATLEAIIGQKLDAITFSSGKTVIHTCQLLEKHFGGHWRQQIARARVISIGPQTSLSCRQYLGRLDGEADPHDLQGLVEACVISLRGPV
jgi:uroporphyrinogen-III synthase